VWCNGGFTAAHHAALAGGSQDGSLSYLRVIPADMSRRFRPLFRFLGVLPISLFIQAIALIPLRPGCSTST